MQLTLDRSLRGIHPHFERVHTPVQVVRHAVALYEQGLSFRQVAKALRRWGYCVHHTTVWRWLQRCGEDLRLKLWIGQLPKTIVVDETLIHSGWGQFWLYAAIDPHTRQVLFMRAYPQRNYDTTKDFFAEMIRTYGGQKPDEVVVDGGFWYIWPLREFGMVRQVVSGSIRNYVERFFRYLKQRMNGFDRYFPQGTSYHPMANWFRVFAWFHNVVVKGGSLVFNA